MSAINLAKNSWGISDIWGIGGVSSQGAWKKPCCLGRHLSAHVFRLTTSSDQY